MRLEQAAPEQMQELAGMEDLAWHAVYADQAPRVYNYFRIIATVARKIGKKYLIDSRVHAHVQLIGQDPSNITYSDLLTILQVYGFAATEGGGYVRVIPDATIFPANRPTSDAQFVNYVLPVENMPATHHE
jgi:hypothetical protein